MVKQAILVVAFVAGCVVLALRRERARGRNPDTVGGHIRGLGLGVFLLPVVLIGHGILGTVWLTAIALILAGIAAVFVPNLAAKALPFTLLAMGLYGFEVMVRYADGYPFGIQYGAVLAGAGSWRTHLVLPQAFAFLAIGIWLLPRTISRPSRTGRVLLGPLPEAGGAKPSPRWHLLLFPVAGLTAELIRASWPSRVSELNAPPPPAAAVLIALTLVVLVTIWLAPAVAADLAIAGLVGLGLYGIIIAVASTELGGAFHAGVLYGAIDVTNQHLAVLAGAQGVLLLGFGLWLVPRALDARTRALFWPDPVPTAEFAGRVEQLTQTRADAVDTAAAELRRVERDLHDGAQARLVALGMSLRAAQRLIPGSPQAAQ